jgi:succinyl-CoA synthetase alpha subunit
MEDKPYLFTKNTQALIYNFKPNAVQRMLDFDYLCRREKPSIAGLISSEQIAGAHKAFFGNKEILIPVYCDIAEAAQAHPKADVLINLASFRSAFETSKKALEEQSIRTIVIIAEGIPERETRELIAMAKSKNKWIIGPATVGGVQAGACKLHRPGSVGFVSKSGGLSNEMYNTIARTTDGIYEGIAIGGDAYPGSTLLDHVLRFERIPEIKMIVVLGELGGNEEYLIADAMKSGKIK